ncbi:MAG: hypothetical protein ACXVA2_24445 [Mucilaginibacter sp.]
MNYTKIKQEDNLIIQTESYDSIEELISEAIEWKKKEIFVSG